MTDTLILSMTHTLVWMFAAGLAGLLALVRGNLAALRAHVWFIRWRTWSLIAGVTLGALWLGGPAALALAALIAWQAAREASALLQLPPAYQRTLMVLAPLATLAVSVWPALLPWLPALAALIFALLTAISVAFFAFLSGLRGPQPFDRVKQVAHRSSPSSLPSLFPPLLAFLWTVWPLACVVRLGHTPDGIAWIVIFGVTVGLADVGACLVGSALGGPRLAPTVSPGKRWSGLLGAVLGAYAAFALLAPLRPPLPPALALALPPLLALTGTLGDLLESWVKRRAGAKDAGAWLPGFGGLLDRIDSALLALPVAYLALRLLAW